MASDSLRFGTSGLRGLVTELAGAEARRHSAGFVAYLRASGQAGNGAVYLARDLRASSPAILDDCAAGVRAGGGEPVDCGALPTPALALWARRQGGAAIMVTGSHIPDDRNGLKFYVPTGEITKADEAGILAALGDDPGPVAGAALRDEGAAARAAYLDRYGPVLTAGRLAGWRVGVYAHSSVLADLLVEILRAAGTEPVVFGRAERFVAVDTEAFSDPVFDAPRAFMHETRLDALVSADGDGDRPLVMDDAGAFVRGDVLGLLAARFLGARTVVTPVTSNGGIEASGFFERVVRTRVGSPYVIAGMEAEADAGPVVGFEANGGTLLGTDVMLAGGTLAALPTRDAVLPILATLGLAAAGGRSVRELVAALPMRHALSDRLEAVPGARSAAFLATLANGGAAGFFAPVGQVAGLSEVDGLRFLLGGGDVVHYRASGNAPELRCYVEGRTPDRAAELLDWGLRAARAAVL